MFTGSLSEKTKSALGLLGKSKILSQAYLAGGTALALQIGHRFSFDLDFFTLHPFSADEVTRGLKEVGDFKPRLSVSHTLLGNFNEVDFSLLLYNFPLINKLLTFGGLNLAGIEDIAAMKLSAISDRGTKRDFIDLYFLLQKFSLERLFEFYEQKYKKLEVNLYHLLKSLVYFADAEEEKMPQMLIKVDWKKIKECLRGKVRQEEKKYLN